MKRRELLGVMGAAGLAASVPGLAQQAGDVPPVQSPTKRRGLIKQGLWRVNFGEDTTLSFDDMCREAVRVGAHGFDLIPPEDWPTLRKYGLEPLLVGTGGVDFENGIIHPEVHDQIERSIRPYIDMCADAGVRTIITIGGQRRGMSYEEGADHAVAFLNRIKGQLEDRGVTIAIENMNNRLTDPRFGRVDQIFGHWDWGVRVCERVDSPNVKLVCDIYHLQIMDGDLARRIRESIRWIAHFHVAGVPTRNEIDDTQEINYRYLAEVIAELDYDGYVSHEWRPAPGRDPLQSIAESMAILDV
ncbi:MAG TPA: TIM barrel protein [Gammaproteobacteria bacterium]